MLFFNCILFYIFAITFLCLH